jgi:phosphate:Na+ symporter
MPVEVGAGVVIGANVGTTLTGILAAIGATSNAKRLAAAHVLFNVVTAVVALAVLTPLLQLIHGVGVWLTGSGDVVTQLVLFHTLFNLLGVLLMWPLSGPLVRFLLARFTTADEDAARPRYLDRNVAAVPVLALQALRHELARLGHLAMQLAREATRLNPVALPWAAPVPQADVRLGRQLQSIEQLQLQIGKFVSETSRGAMHKEVATQLPELLRIATHFDTLARVMHHVGVQGNHTPRADESPGLSLLILPGMPERAPADAAPPGTDIVACVVPVFTAAEAFFAAADPEGPQQAQGGPWLAGEARAAFEEGLPDGEGGTPARRRGRAGSMSMRCTTGCHGSATCAAPWSRATRPASGSRRCRSCLGRQREVRPSRWATLQRAMAVHRRAWNRPSKRLKRSFFNSCWRL